MSFPLSFQVCTTVGLTLTYSTVTLTVRLSLTLCTNNASNVNSEKKHTFTNIVFELSPRVAILLKFNVKVLFTDAARHNVAIVEFEATCWYEGGLELVLTVA